MKKLLCVFMAICLLFTFTACGSGGGTKVGLITDVGGVNDQSFNQSAWEGLKNAEKNLDVKAKYLESHVSTDYATHIATMVEEQMKLIWGIGFMMGDDFQSAAAAYADQQFAIIDYAYADSDIANGNMIGVVFAAEEASFLVGYIAGKTTKTNKVGHINGVASPTMEAFAVGFYAGVKAANPECEVIGQYSGTFTEPATGRTIAQQMYAADCDIIYAACGDTGNGVIETARELGKWVIGVDKDQNHLAPDNVLTSALKRVDVAVEDVTKRVVNSDSLIRDTLLYNLANSGVGYTTTGNHIEASVITDVENIKNDIISGTVKVPSTKAAIDAEYPDFYDLAGAQ